MNERESWADRQLRAAIMARSLAAAAAPVERRKKLTVEVQQRVDLARKAYNPGWITGGSTDSRGGVPLQVVLKPVEVIKPPVVYPKSFLPETIVPQLVAHPTIPLGVGGLPFTPYPATLVQLVSGAVLGSMIVTIGRRLILTMGMTGLEFLSGELSAMVRLAQKDAGVQVKFHTGKGYGRGKYVRIRPAGGGAGDDDADPYHDPDDGAWWQFWA